MISIVSLPKCLGIFSSQKNKTKKLTLRDIKEIKGEVNEIRFLLKGNCEKAAELFKVAVREGEPKLQIQLAFVIQGMKKGKDYKKDFFTLKCQDLEEFRYYPSNYRLYTSVYDHVIGIDDWKVMRERAHRVFTQAANNGYIPAVLESIAEKWKKNLNSYGFAVQLRPYLGSDKMLDYYFGRALKNSVAPGSELFYEGLHWMEMSCGICVEFPKNEETFDALKQKYLPLPGVFEHQGIIFENDKAIAPSEKVWDQFISTKVRYVLIARKESYLIESSSREIRRLLIEYKVSTSCQSVYYEESVSGTLIPYNKYSLNKLIKVEILHIYLSCQLIGKISVRLDNFAIFESISSSKLQVIVAFVEKIMSRTGSAKAAQDWLKQIRMDEDEACSTSHLVKYLKV